MADTTSVHTETFMIEAKDEAEAKAKALEMVATRELHEVEHSVVVQDIKTFTVHLYQEVEQVAEAAANDAEAEIKKIGAPEPEPR